MSDAFEGRGLPTKCHVVMPGFPEGANVGVSVRGRLGLEMTALNFGGDALARAVVCALNEVRGVDPAAEHAMLVGAMHGWESDRADPRFLRRYDRRFAGGDSAYADCATRCIDGA